MTSQRIASKRGRGAPSAPTPSAEEFVRPPRNLASGESWWFRQRWAVPLASIVIFLSLWELIGINVNPITLATPYSVVTAFIHMASSGVLLPAFITAMEDFLAGYCLAIIVGMLVGILMGRSRLAERALSPYISFFQAMPSIAAIPLLVIWFGVGYEARVATTFWLALLPVLINTYAGIRATPKSLKEVGRIYHLPQLVAIRRIALPAAMPFIFTGLRRALGLGLIGMLIAEMEISVSGLGGLVITYGDDLRTDYLLAAICLAAIVGVIGVALLELARRTWFSWIDAVAGQESGRAQ